MSDNHGSNDLPTPDSPIDACAGVLGSEGVNCGYHNPGYALSLACFGEPLALHRSGGSLLKRPIPGTTAWDAMGCYPLFACRQWENLPEDLMDARDSLVSVALVADPFGDYDLGLLHRCFDRVVPFKEHFVTDLSQPLERVISSSHRKRARQALRQLDVEICGNPREHLAEWVELYDQLVKRHQIKGIQAFSPQSFAHQLALPGMIMLRARHKGETVGATLWLLQGEVAYGHLAACNERGYALRATYALDGFALSHFARTSVRWLNFGGVAGTDAAGSVGLANYKRGWATGTRPAYFCGRILDPSRYEAITAARKSVDADYFPAYRHGEFR